MNDYTIQNNSYNYYHIKAKNDTQAKNKAAKFFSRKNGTVIYDGSGHPNDLVPLYRHDGEKWQKIVINV